ncbi:M56 family metallopeptidase [Agathobaculum sp.]|uniref:M56 family metallopeptidase n=1 Tax=Agathobaculum sp. TaxID=2048138 RepID=UPI002A7FF16C|nr:M56 family metallopeptidase [Agathobaculum sp.]MDY3619289.1 M56 family metallopeptidase [Agathobaculum sp.]
MKWEDLLFSAVQIGLTVSLVALVPIVLRRVLKKRYPARAMCLVWALLAVRLLVPVQITLPEPPVQVTPRTYYVLQNDQLTAGTGQNMIDPADSRWVTRQQVAQIDRDNPNNPASATAIDVSGPLAALWLLGVFCFAAAQIELYLRYSRRLRRHAGSVQSATLCRVFNEQKRALSIRRAIPLRVSPAADCPMLAGFFRPVLYLPDEALSEQEAAFVFRHELTHYRHGDLWLKLLLVLARAVQWFNPLVHLMARFAYEDIELACDDAVARQMDGAQRRAYGETILRSAVERAKRRALMSCFNGDKETLMRRFEGLFDKTAKKRGIALVLAAALLTGTLGCAFSVGGEAEKLTREEILWLAEQAAEAKLADGFSRYTVVPETDTALLILAQDGEDTQETRVAERLFFEKDGDGWRVAKIETAAAKADSLENFRIFYENDLGLPEDGVLAHLEGGTAETVREWDATGDGENESSETRYTFADGSVLLLTGSQWADGNGENNRTAADLAQQYGRAVSHKSVWPLYDVLSEDGQQRLAEHQRNIVGSEPGGVWYTKFGGSSPSYRNFVVVPSGEPDSAIVVFQGYGGGTTDFRSANKVLIGKENGRSVITGFEEYDTWQSWMLTELAPQKAELTKSKLFKLYYATGLPWPELYGGATTTPDTYYNAGHYSDLMQPVSAAETVFGYFGDQEEHAEGDPHEFRWNRWFSVSLLMQQGEEAVVRLTFIDGSEPLDVRMQKNGDYWLPAYLVQQDAGQPEDVQAVDTVRAIESVTYTNPVYGYTLSLPESFVGAGFIDERDPANVLFGMRFAAGDEPGQEFQYGTVMNVTVDLTALFKKNYGEDWAAGFPVPCVPLDERDGMSWFAALASDVQYDPADEAKAAGYRKLYGDAEAMTEDALSFDGQTVEQKQACEALRLQKQGEAYAYTLFSAAEELSVLGWDTAANLEDNSCTVTISYSNLSGDYVFRTVERVWFTDKNALEPARTETLLNTSDGVRSMEAFGRAYGGSLGMPDFEGTLEALRKMAAKSASPEPPDLSTPEACAATLLHLVGGKWSARTDVQDNAAECRATYQWADGSVEITMRRASPDASGLWLPVGFQMEDGRRFPAAGQ